MNGLHDGFMSHIQVVSYGEGLHHELISLRLHRRVSQVNHPSKRWQIEWSVEVLVFQGSQVGCTTSVIQLSNYARDTHSIVITRIISLFQTRKWNVISLAPYPLEASFLPLHHVEASHAYVEYVSHSLPHTQNTTHVFAPRHCEAAFHFYKVRSNSMMSSARL